MEDKTPSVGLGKLSFWKIKHQAFELEKLDFWKIKPQVFELRNWDFKRIEYKFWALKMSSSFFHSFVFSPLKQ